MVAVALQSERDDRAHGDQFVIMRGVKWSDYQRLLEMRGEHSAPRITYVEGTVQLMSPSLPHEWIKSNIGRLVEAYCFERRIKFRTCGSWTVESEEADRGAEPDECYVFTNRDAPKAPELAIEVVWTSGGIDKLDVYRKLNVREVWYWRRGKLTPFVLRGENYEERAESEVLAGIDLSLLARFAERPDTSDAILEYRDALKG